jgi:hypothetical protein
LAVVKHMFASGSSLPRGVVIREESDGRWRIGKDLEAVASVFEPVSGRLSNAGKREMGSKEAKTDLLITSSSTAFSNKIVFGFIVVIRELGKGMAKYLPDRVHHLAE